MTRVGLKQSQSIPFELEIFQMKKTSFLTTLPLSFALACLPLVSGCSQPAGESDAPAVTATVEEGSDSHDEGDHDHADHEGSGSHDAAE